MRIAPALRSMIVAMSLMLIAGLASAAEVVNLNKADAAAIQQSLVGIGPIKAESIISYRKKNGKFKSVDDLLNVKGIGPALIKKNKRYLSLSKGVVSGDSKQYAAARKQAKAKQSSSGSSSGSKSKTSKSADKSSGSSKKASKDSKSTSKSTKSSDKPTTAKKSKSKSSTKKSTSKSSKSSKSKKCDGKTKHKDCKKKTSKKKSKGSKSKNKKKTPAT